MPDVVGEVFEVKQWSAGDVMVFTVRFAAEVHLRGTLSKKNHPIQLDAPKNVLEFMYGE